MPMAIDVTKSGFDRDIIIVPIGDGDTTHAYVVKDGEQTVGTLDMTEQVRALVPRVASEAGARQS